MKKVLINIALLFMLVTACSPQALPTDSGSDVEDQATQISAELTPAQQAAISKLALNIGVPADEIKLISAEAVEWPDSCFGIAREGISCAQVITPGQQIILEANGKQVEYRSNDDGTVILPATVALTWQRVGGVAGFCDSLTIYLSGEVQGSTCNNGEMVEKQLTELLSAEEIATMNEWISKYGVVSIDASDPQGVADGMSVQLQLFGTGTEQISSPEVQQILMEFVQNLNQKLMSQ